MTVVELEWGSVGARLLAERCDVVVVVDVLSFTTSLTIATARGAVVWPYHGLQRADGAEELARAVGAHLVRGRASGAELTLSPATMLGLEPGTRLVMPSPNGSTIAHAAVASGRPLLAASLRNARAVASYLSGAASVGLVPAGELWPDATLRPAYEDLVGAGAVAGALAAAGAELSPDAAAAALAAGQRRPLGQCPSGRELLDKGFPHDVELAEEADVDTVVPELRDGRFLAVT
jgi:2-phosphosulfolactate phosphatase